MEKEVTSGMVKKVLLFKYSSNEKLSSARLFEDGEVSNFEVQNKSALSKIWK